MPFHCVIAAGVIISRIDFQKMKCTKEVENNNAGNTKAFPKSAQEEFQQFLTRSLELTRNDKVYKPTKRVFVRSAMDEMKSLLK